MIDSMLLDKKMILPCAVYAVYLEGEYDISGLFVGVPVKLGAGGVEEIIHLQLADEEQAALRKSTEGVRKVVEAIGM